MIPSEIHPLLVAAFKAGSKVLIKGGPGIGKTQIVAQAAAEAGFELIVSHPSISDPTDFKGMPAIMRPKVGIATAEFLPFGDLLQLIEAKVPTVAFADDLGQATHAVQAAYMQPLEARHINGHKISDKVVFCAATNDTTHKAGVNAILEPVKSRFDTILELTVDVDDWCTWAFKNNMPGELIGFIRFRPNLLSGFKPTRELTNSPSPRTAAAIGKWFNAGVKNMEVFAGCAGPGFAAEFMGFLQVYAKLPSLDAILLDPSGELVPTEPAALFAVATGLTKKASADNFDRVLTYLGRMPKEFEVCAVRDCQRVHRDWMKVNRAFSRWTVENAKNLA